LSEGVGSTPTLITFFLASLSIMFNHFFFFPFFFVFLFFYTFFSFFAVFFIILDLVVSVLLAVAEENDIIVWEKENIDEMLDCFREDKDDGVSKLMSVLGIDSYTDKHQSFSPARYS
jgi:hypothetical protein